MLSRFLRARSESISVLASIAPLPSDNIGGEIVRTCVMVDAARRDVSIAGVNQLAHMRKLRFVFRQQLYACADNVVCSCEVAFRDLAGDDFVGLWTGNIGFAHAL